MSDVGTLVHWMLVGAIVAPTIILASVTFLQTYDFLSRANWEDDATRRQIAKVIPVYVARWMRHETDWKTVGKFALYSSAVGPVVTGVGFIFVIGFAEVFL